MERPPEMMGMDVAWPYKRRQLGDTITYHCPNNKLTWAEEAAEQTVTCIWHRQTDSMMWWPQDLKLCNRESATLTNSTVISIVNGFTFSFYISIDY